LCFLESFKILLAVYWGREEDPFHFWRFSLLPFQSYWTWYDGNRIFTLCRMITGVVFLRMFWNFISNLPVKRGGSLSFLVGTISNVLVMEIGWTDVGSGGYILVSCAHSNTSFLYILYEIYSCRSELIITIIIVFEITNVQRLPRRVNNRNITSEFYAGFFKSISEYFCTSYHVQIMWNTKTMLIFSPCYVRF
jgi:hypothetical protein